MGRLDREDVEREGDTLNESRLGAGALQGVSVPDFAGSEQRDMGTATVEAGEGRSEIEVELEKAERDAPGS